MTDTLQWFSYQTPICPLSFAWNDQALLAVSFDESAAHIKTYLDRNKLGQLKDKPTKGSPFEKAFQDWFDGDLTAFGDIPVAPVGTPFNLSVWKALQAIPSGETRTYGALAKSLGSPGAARAVGLACNRNPIAVVIPCHRVVGSTGKLTGFAGGLNVKAWLLNHEGVGTQEAQYRLL